jgi:hypothetical protein
VNSSKDSHNPIPLCHVWRPYGRRKMRMCCPAFRWAERTPLVMQPQRGPPPPPQPPAAAAARTYTGAAAVSSPPDLGTPPPPPPQQLSLVDVCQKLDQIIQLLCESNVQGNTRQVTLGAAVGDHLGSSDEST